MATMFIGVDYLPAFTYLMQEAGNTAAGNSNLIWQVIQGIVLGIVQGITEFLPISSTAHLIIFRDVLGWKATWNKAAIDGIQLGSVFAVGWYFRKDIFSILEGAWAAFQRKQWQREEWKIFVGIIIGTAPALLGGLVLKILKVELESPLTIAGMSIVMATLLGLAEKIGSRKRGFEELEIKDGILVGLGQMIALLPGASRSGSTLTTALFLGLERQTAARFSFLLGFPTLAIATLVQTKDVLEVSNMFVPMIVGIISTFIFSYLSIAWLLKFLQRNSNWVFVWYRLAFGAAILGAIATGVKGLQ
ncbi:undecaprenyl-diphosphatase [Dulcicalothrix desertica PCC 7102]|uniref:Undecaprenyl-diphosphatase n=1 Tax=Dulcicalothrix desertica PCC 7102 TaxID=232991 RepID=A0A433VF33_9CYAN|nr:undecaprenyl-diphosphate phosphatase [Dulcicalothrix desertica]RUT04704.1 undecaprenyl-diphosphatase [Dulcicalothrix desertica PCC 7102]TWH42711.1 undecaprenyl-diphosphatase [Dulcicalothrix desertica PCC 7102]